MKYAYYCLLLLFCFSCKKVWHKANTHYTPQMLESHRKLSEDAEVAAMISPYKSKLDAEMNKVIGQCLVEMPKRKPECVLGNWMADAMEEKAEALTGKDIDFAFQNYGGIRIPALSKGPITTGKIYELMPFDNQLVIVEMNGATLRQLILHIAADNGWPLSRSIKVQIAGDKSKINIDGEPIQLEQKYRVAMPDYIANGGNDCFFLMDQKQKVLDVLIRDVLLEYVQNKKELNGKLEGRFVIN